VSSIATPTPPTIFLNTTASVVGLTARTAPSLPKYVAGESFRPINVKRSPSPNEITVTMYLPGI
jgi:hypothetical protein